MDAGRQPSEFARIWLHTHPADSAQPSGVDEETFRSVFGTCDWSLMFILAAGGATYARLHIVESTNITTQGYFASDLGETKVAATGRLVETIDPEIETTVICDRYRAGRGCSPVVFCCVDSISARAAIWRSVRDGCAFWCDGRMLGEVMRVLTVAGPQSRDHYDRSQFPQADAQRGACTAHGTIYAASIAAGLMVHQFTRWLRSLPLDSDLTLNLLAGELSSAPSHEHRL